MERRNYHNRSIARPSWGAASSAGLPPGGPWRRRPLARGGPKALLLQVNCKLRHRCGVTPGMQAARSGYQGAHRLTLANLMGKACDGAVVKVMGEGRGALALAAHLGALASNIAVALVCTPALRLGLPKGRPTKGGFHILPLHFGAPKRLGKRAFLVEATPHRASSAWATGLPGTTGVAGAFRWCGPRRDALPQRQPTGHRQPGPGLDP